MKTAFLYACLAALAPQASGTGTYSAATVRPDGVLVITRTDGRRIQIAKTTDQTGWQDAAVSPERDAVGAQALFPNCCTSYDIPLELVVYAEGKLHRFRGNGLPIWKWRFEGEGRVAYSQTTVHSGCSDHYELRELRTGRLLDSTDVWHDAPACPPVTTPARIPAWAQPLVGETR